MTPLSRNGFHSWSQSLFAAAALLAAVRSVATTTNYSIGLNFGADEYYVSSNPTRAGTLLPTEVAGVPGVEQANWNNLEGALYTATDLVADNQGAGVNTTAAVTWNCNNTWAADVRGANNVGFPTNSPNYKLYVGYLDSGSATTTTISIDTLPEALTSPGYDVYIYTLGGAANRGGGYRVVDLFTQDVLREYKYGDDVAAPNSFIEDPGSIPTTPSVATTLSFAVLTGRISLSRQPPRTATGLMRAEPPIEPR